VLCRIDGKQVKDHSPLKSIGQGVALCPKTAKAAGIVGELTGAGKHHPGHTGRRGWSGI